MTFTAQHLDEIGTNISRSDLPGTVIPADPGNRHYAEIIEAGITIQPYVAPRPSRSYIDAEAARRTKAGFVFQGVHFQFDDLAKSRITGASSMAHIAITLGGKSPTDLRWHGGDEDFTWIATDNSEMPMNAGTVLAFGQTAGNWESAHVRAAKVLKDTDPIPTDYATNAAYWP